MAGHTAGDSRKPSEHLSATTTPPPDDLTLDEQGWVVSNNQIRLIWVPYDIRRFLVCPPTATIISRDGFVRLDFLGANVGTEWQGCFDSSEPSYQLVQ
ncbi:hypothetical protein FRC10_001154 [Ceratobasidium sp. 414]|nr:hypothetical protein FRC10_001154 [Ceratobasidium sp. 414]